MACLLQFDGCALNESRALAYKEKIPPRKKVKKPQPPPPPRKPTLLELAMLKNCSVDDRPAPTVEILMKQKQLAHQIAAKSQVPRRFCNRISFVICCHTTATKMCSLIVCSLCDQFSRQRNFRKCWLLN